MSLFASLSVDAQFVTTFAKNVAETQEDGIIYYIPRNVIKLEFTIEETNYYIGPYAEFATKMLDITDYVKENKTEYVIKDVDIQLATESDPQAVYCISQDEKGKDPLPNVILDNDGIILALGYDSIPSRLKIMRNTLVSNDINPEIPTVSFLEILDNEVEIEDDDDDDDDKPNKKKITKEDKAKTVLEKINQIRTSYFELVAGTNEVAYGDMTAFMAESMKNAENEYLSLFKGKVTKHTYTKTVFVTPEKNQMNSSVSVAKLSSTDGFVDAAGKGDVIKLQFESINSLPNIKAMDNDTQKTSQSNKVFYRIPAKSNAKVLYGTKVLAEKQLIISQFGEIKCISAKGNKILFNPNTGQVISVLK